MSERKLWGVEHGPKRRRVVRLTDDLGQAERWFVFKWWWIKPAIVTVRIYV